MYTCTHTCTHVWLMWRLMGKVFPRTNKYCCTPQFGTEAQHSSLCCPQSGPIKRWQQRQMWGTYVVYYMFARVHVFGHRRQPQTIAVDRQAALAKSCQQHRRRLHSGDCDFCERVRIVPWRVVVCVFVCIGRGASVHTVCIFVRHTRHAYR